MKTLPAAMIALFLGAGTSLAESPAPAAPQGPVYFDGPVYVIPAAPQAELPPLPPPPVLPAPERWRDILVTNHTRAPKTLRLGLGAYGAALWTNQQLFGANLLMYGGGARARLHLLPSFALELSFAGLSTNLRDGTLVRQSYPLQLGALLYLIPPRPGLHFNVHGIVGGGILPSRFTLARDTPAEFSESTLELVGQLGTGFEMRFSRFAITADARALLLWRATKTGGTVPPTLPPGVETYLETPESAAYRFTGLQKPLVPDQGYGWSLDLGAMFWL